MPTTHPRRNHEGTKTPRVVSSSVESVAADIQSPIHHRDTENTETHRGLFILTPGDRAHLVPIQLDFSVQTLWALCPCGENVRPIERRPFDANASINVS